MARESTRLRTTDLRAIYLIVGECLELGADPILWRRHLLQRLNSLFGAVASVDIEVPPTDAAGSSFSPAASHAVNVDQLSPSERLILDRCFREMSVAENPLGQRVLIDVGQRRISAATRRECVDNVAWRTSPLMVKYFEPLGWDDMLIGCSASTGGHLHLLNFSRLSGEVPFAPRTSHMLRLVLRELDAIPDTRLAPWRSGSLLDLPPRLREVLLALAEGDTEKQIAFRLGVSRPTVHEYVRRLFVRYGTSSRSQMLIQAARQIHAARVAGSHLGSDYWLYGGQESLSPDSPGRRRIG